MQACRFLRPYNIVCNATEIPEQKTFFLNRKWMAQLRPVLLTFLHKYRWKVRGVPVEAVKA